MNKNSNLKNIKSIYKELIIKLRYKLNLLKMPSFFGLRVLLLPGDKSKLLHNHLMVSHTIIVVCNIPTKVARLNGLTT